MPPKKFNCILKKKIKDKRILYKIEWSNGSISYEPFIELDQELLKHVEKWELQQYQIDQKQTQQPSEQQLFTAPKKIKTSEYQKPELKEKPSQTKNSDQINEDEQEKTKKSHPEITQSDSKREKKQRKITEKTSLKPKQSTTNVIPSELIRSNSNYGSEEDQNRSKIKVTLKNISQITEKNILEQEIKTRKLKEQFENLKKDAQETRSSRQRSRQGETTKPEILKETPPQLSGIKPSDSPKRKIGKNQTSIEQVNNETQQPHEIQNYMTPQQEAKAIEPKKQNIKSPTRRHLCVKASKISKKTLQEAPQEKEDEQDYQLASELEKLEGQGHQPKLSIPCKILQARKKEELQQLEFLVQYEDQITPNWISQSEIREKAPRALCEYLLGRVSWGFGK